MYGVLGEDKSDVETLEVLIRRISGKANLTIKGKGYRGGHLLRKKGAGQIQLFAKLGLTKFVICHDADGPDPAPRYDAIDREVRKRSGLEGACCIVIPVQEIEAWLLADIEAVTKIFSGWRPEAIKNPESVPNPKEYLEALSRVGVVRPRYSHATHNQRLAAHIDLELLKHRCPSARDLFAFVLS